MIKHIVFGGGITGNCNPTMPYINMNNPSAGIVRYNGVSQSMEVYDGNTWIQLGQYGDAQLDGRSRSAIDWVHKKIQQELELEELMKQNPTVAKAKEHFDLIVALAKEYKHE
jgi:hypothetical protein